MTAISASAQIIHYLIILQKLTSRDQKLMLGIYLCGWAIEVIRGAKITAKSRGGRENSAVDVRVNEYELEINEKWRFDFWFRFGVLEIS